MEVALVPSTPAPADAYDQEATIRTLFTSRKANPDNPLIYFTSPPDLPPYVPPPPVDESVIAHTFEPEDYSFKPDLSPHGEKRIRELCDTDMF